MIAAIEAVINGQGVTAAAKLHNVPKSTLHDRMYSGCGTKPGPRPYLTTMEESELMTCNAGYGKTRGEVKMIVENSYLLIQEEGRKLQNLDRRQNH